MSEHKDSLYNANDAMALSLRLTGSASSPPAEETTSFVRFSAASRTKSDIQRTSRVTVSRGPSEPPLDHSPKNFRTWEEMLLWCLDASKANASFVVDSQGFVLMREGRRIPADGFEGAGANLGVALDQLNQMDINTGEIQFADLEYEKGPLLVFKVKDRHNDYFMVGVIGFGEVTATTKKLMYRQISRNVERLA